MLQGSAMGKIFGIIGLVLLLAAIVIAPAGSSNAATQSAMATQDGSPCHPSDCKPMPDCPIALPGLAGLFAPGMWATAVGINPNLVSSGFLIDPRRLLASVPNEGVRRPPKI